MVSSQGGCEKLELALLSFFEQFRKIYIGDQVRFNCTGRNPVQALAMFLNKMNFKSFTLFVCLSFSTCLSLSSLRLFQNQSLIFISPCSNCVNDAIHANFNAISLDANFSSKKQWWGSGSVPLIFGLPDPVFFFIGSGSYL